METFEDVIVLQEIDTEITQIEHRAAHLPEAVAVRELEAEVAATNADRARNEAEVRALAETIESGERNVADLRKQIARLSTQLRTVISPREAEALQHEIVVLEQRISALDDDALAALERSEELDGVVRGLIEKSAGLSGRLDAAREALDAARVAVRAMFDDARLRRGDVAGRIDGQWLARYDERRAAHAGTAVARLVRATCGGCHLDLSPSEVEAVRRLSPTERECPNCARWLVV